MKHSLLSSQENSSHDSLLIVSAFVGLLASIWVLGLLGAGVGFSIWPLGEDNNWIDLLQGERGAAIARAFWAIDHRNPLSPWWYIAAKWIILSFDGGLLALRYAMALLLALSTYAMIVAVAGKSARLFAVAVSMTIVVWMANRYLDQIYWNFQGALAASIISVAAFARSLEEGKNARQFYALSIVAWFIAFATYTIQCGAVIAMAYLSMQRTPHSPELSRWRNLYKALWQTGLNILPHMILFVLFVLIWETTMTPGAIRAFSLKLDFFRVMASIREGLLISDFHVFFRRLVDSPSWIAFAVASTVAAGALFALLRARARARTLPLASPVAPVGGIVDFLVVTACIVAPTIVVESGSAAWTPGTRWPMLYQFSTPAVLIGLPTLLIVLMIRSRPKQAACWTVTVAIVFGTGVLFALAHNRLQNDATSFEKFVRGTIERTITEDFLLGREPPLQLLLMIRSEGKERWRGLDTMGPTLSRVWFQRPDVSFRLISQTPAPVQAFATWWTVGFGPNSDGIRNAKAWGGTVPYSQIIVLKFEDNGAQRLSELHLEELRDWNIAWNRTEPVKLPEVNQSKLCPLRWSPEQPMLGMGWGAPERDPASRPFRWTTSRSAVLTMPNSCGRPEIIRVKVIDALSRRNLEELRLRLNGVALATHRQQDVDGTIYEAAVPKSFLVRSSILSVAVEVNALDTIPEADREFGVAVASVEIISEPDSRETAP